MPSAVEIRTDYSAWELRRLAASSRHANQSRRLLSLAAVLDGMSRDEAARIGGMGRQTLRDWTPRFNAAGPEGLKDIRSKGHPPWLTPEQLAAFAEIEDEITALTALRDKPSGSIRLTLSDHAFESVVWPKLKPILRDYPDIGVELILDSTFRNIVEEGFDAGARLGESVERAMIAVRIGPDWRLVAVASPAYLDAHGVPGEMRRDVGERFGASQAVRAPFPHRRDMDLLRLP